MTTVSRPNRDTLDKAIGIYRDSMRAFLVHHLRTLPGQHLEEAVGSVLQRNYNKYEEFQRHRQQSGGVEDFIDVSDFLSLMLGHWNTLFARLFNGDRDVQTEIRLVHNARNRVSHPGTQDLGSEETKYYLFAISSVLGRIGRREEQGRVDEMCGGIPDATTAALAMELAQVAPKVSEHTAQIEMLENTIELLRARLEALDKYREDSAVAIDRLFGETSDLEESLEDLVPRIGSLEQGEDGDGEEDEEEDDGEEDEEEDDGEEDEEEDDGEEDEEEDDGEEDEEEDDGEETLEGATPALPRSLGLMALLDHPVETPIEAANLEATRTTLRQRIVSGLNIFPSARFYCTEPDCRFYDGTRKAWYNEDKAIEHEQMTGHDIGTVHR